MRFELALRLGKKNAPAQDKMGWMVFVVNLTGNFFSPLILMHSPCSVWLRGAFDWTGKKSGMLTKSFNFCSDVMSSISSITSDNKF